MRPITSFHCPKHYVPAPAVLPGHDTYGEGLLTGRIECELETCSPTYIRGVLTPADFKEFGEKGPDELKVEDKRSAVLPFLPRMKP